MKLLFLGRFQPIHKGHVAIIKELSEKYDDIVIAIGSASMANTMLNPFTAEDREKMVRLALDATGINYGLVLIPNIPDDSKYVDHIMAFTLFDIVFTGNDFVRGLFEKAGCKVIPFYEEIERYGHISSSKIRLLIKQAKEWKHLVPEKVAEYIEQVDGVKLIQSL